MPTRGTGPGRSVTGQALPGELFFHAARSTEASGETGPLVLSLAEFATVRTEQQLLSVLDNIASTHFGAVRAILLSSEPALVSAHRIPRLAGGAASQCVQVGEPAVQALLKRGDAFLTVTPHAHLPGVPVPAEAARAVLVPCCGEGSMNAVCAFWTADAPHLPPSGFDRLRLVAAMAGLAFDRQVSEQRGRMLRADLDNRIRNVLAVIRSVGTRSAERAASMEDFLLHYEGRIDAIGRSQIAAVRHGEISFELLLREELLAQAIQDEANISLEGMDVPVSSEQAEALGLAIHELAVNAVKFGALAGPGGSLAVRWWVESGADSLALNIDWRENCGATPCPGRPDRDGFGLTYLERALPFQLNAEVTLGISPQGLRCQIAAPLHRAPGRRARGFPGMPAPLPTGRRPAAPNQPGQGGARHRMTDLLRS